MDGSAAPSPASALDGVHPADVGAARHGGHAARCPYGVRWVLLSPAPGAGVALPTYSAAPQGPLLWPAGPWPPGPDFQFGRWLVTAWASVPARVEGRCGKEHLAEKNRTEQIPLFSEFPLQPSGSSCAAGFSMIYIGSSFLYSGIRRKFIPGGCGPGGTPPSGHRDRDAGRCSSCPSIMDHPAGRPCILGRHGLVSRQRG